MISLTLNWFGMAVHDVPTASDFYSKKLGISFEENEAHGPWRYFQTRGMVFEMFQAHRDRIKVKAWGSGQAFRPIISVRDISTTTAMLQDQGVPFSHTTSELGSKIEMIGPEGIRWGLAENPEIDMEWAHPLIDGIELKAANLVAQRNFYTQILGMTIERETDQTIHLVQQNAEAWLRIQAGGTSAQTKLGEEKPAFFHPIWISYETDNVKHANVWLQEQNVNILHPLTYHQDWNGTDIIIADADGNAIQVVQYGKSSVD